MVDACSWDVQLSELLTIYDSKFGVSTLSYRISSMKRSLGESSSSLHAPITLSAVPYLLVPAEKTILPHPTMGLRKQAILY